jgi:hypothetical protein
MRPGLIGDDWRSKIGDSWKKLGNFDPAICRREMALLHKFLVPPAFSITLVIFTKKRFPDFPISKFQIPIPLLNPLPLPTPFGSVKKYF